MPFSLRIRFGEYEVELCGTRKEVLETLNDLSALVANVSKAFEEAKQSLAKIDAEIAKLKRS